MTAGEGEGEGDGTLGARGPRGSYAQGRARQLEILDGAARVFARRGFRGGSLREVAAESGVAHGTIVHHFGTKDNLLIALLEHRDALGTVEVEARSADGDYIGGLREIVMAPMRTPGIAKLTMTLVAEATSPDHPAHDFFVKRYERVHAEFVANLRELAPTRSRARANQIALHASALIAVMDGLQLQWLLDATTDVRGIFDEELIRLGYLDRP